MIAPILGVVVAGPNEHSRVVSEGALQGAARRRGGAARWEGSSTVEEERINFFLFSVVITYPGVELEHARQ